MAGADNYGKYDSERVVAWQKLPEPYKGENK